MTWDDDCAHFLRWALPQLELNPVGFRRVRGQVCKRLRRRVQALGAPGLAGYRQYLALHPGEWGFLAGMCRISVSRFYRDARVWDALRTQLVPGLVEQAGPRGTVAIWSAGCAAGEEPYTLALLWQRELAARHPGITLRIVATDADPVALERARAGCYRASSLKELPAAWRSAFAPRGALLCLDEGVRAGVEFRVHDLRDSPPAGPFDLVLCRNLVFSYFAEPARTRAALQLIAQLTPGGVLVTGTDEGVEVGALGLTPIDPTIPGAFRRRAG